MDWNGIFHVSLKISYRLSSGISSSGISKRSPSDSLAFDPAHIDHCRICTRGAGYGTNGVIYMIEIDERRKYFEIMVENAFM
jgi:hypothetical protein